MKIYDPANLDLCLQALNASEEPKGPTLSLVGQNLFGDQVSWGGSVIGFLVAGAAGFAFGYLLAVMINRPVVTVEADLWQKLERIRESDG